MAYEQARARYPNEAVLIDGYELKWHPASTVPASSPPSVALAPAGTVTLPGEPAPAGAEQRDLSCQKCFGTGRSRKGGPCKECRGTGTIALSANPALRTVQGGLEFLGMTFAIVQTVILGAVALALMALIIYAMINVL